MCVCMWSARLACWPEPAVVLFLLLHPFQARNAHQVQSLHPLPHTLFSLSACCVVLLLPFRISARPSWLARQLGASSGAAAVPLLGGTTVGRRHQVAYLCASLFSCSTDLSDVLACRLSPLCCSFRQREWRDAGWRVGCCGKGVPEYCGCSLLYLAASTG